MNNGFAGSMEPANPLLCVPSKVFIFHIIQVTIFSDPMVNALLALADSENKKYYHYGGVFTRGQYIPIGGMVKTMSKRVLILSIDVH